ncbi:MAG TPA: DNA repair protein RecN [Sphingobacterium sp.]|nr:DNA repair protein RecN [Sphingobacterium sp.]
MLNRLLIRNYALIDTLDVRLDQHLNIITGETGAGKSIVLGALGLILGNRVENRYFYDESKKCVIEGHFQINSYGLQPFFSDKDLDYEKETIIRREIVPEGRSRAFINDTPVTLAVLKELGAKLIDIHSQHATLQLKQESFQRQVIDSVAENMPLLRRFGTAYKERDRLRKQIEQLQKQIATAKAEQDYYQFLFEELEQAQLIKGEDKELEEEQQMLENAGLIMQNIGQALNILEEGEGNILQSLREVIFCLKTLSEYIPTARGLLERINSVEIELKDISFEMSGIQQNTDLDENRVEYVNERINTLYHLFKKHQVNSSESLIGIRADIEEKLQRNDDLELKLAELQSENKAKTEECERLGEELTKSRKKVLPNVKRYVEDNLAKLGMSSVQFEIQLEETAELNRYGRDDITFLFAANKGQSPLPIENVASGGELSRVMLVIKSMVAQSSALPTIVFDEIDNGVSGEVALSVGQQLEKLSENMQVLVISHLPQIAARGKTHFKVFKENQVGKAVTSIVQLQKEERVQEIAEMLSGFDPGKAALQNATELIGK